MLIDRVYAPFSRYFRRSRMRLFVSAFKITDETRIIDVGGTLFNWKLIDKVPKLTIVNVDIEEHVEDNATFMRADGRSLPFPDNAFDIAYSNSVIEHVGDWEAKEAFAREIRRVANGYFVQTPNFYFPLDQHLFTPLTHFLPKSILKKVLRNGTVLGWLVRPTPEVVEWIVNATSLLSISDMRKLFPDAEFHRERFLGMTKSIVAIGGRQT